MITSYRDKLKQLKNRAPENANETKRYGRISRIHNDEDSNAQDEASDSETHNDSTKQKNSVQLKIQETWRPQQLLYSYE